MAEPKKTAAEPKNEAVPDVSKNPSWIYHETEEPKILPADAPVPEDWTRNPKQLKKMWIPKDQGGWARR